MRVKFLSSEGVLSIVGAATWSLFSLDKHPFWSFLRIMFSVWPSAIWWIEWRSVCAQKFNLLPLLVIPRLSSTLDPTFEQDVEVDDYQYGACNGFGCRRFTWSLCRLYWWRWFCSVQAAAQPDTSGWLLWRQDWASCSTGRSWRQCGLPRLL